MSGKRILGFLFIILAVFMSFTILLQMPLSLKAFLGLWKHADQDDTAYHVGYALGVMGITITIAVVTWFLWKYGIQWSKKNNHGT